MWSNSLSHSFYMYFTEDQQGRNGMGNQTHRVPCPHVALTLMPRLCLCIGDISGSCATFIVWLGLLLFRTVCASGEQWSGLEPPFTSLAMAQFLMPGSPQCHSLFNPDFVLFSSCLPVSSCLSYFWILWELGSSLLNTLRAQQCCKSGSFQAAIEKWFTVLLVQLDPSRPWWLLQLVANLLLQRAESEVSNSRVLLSPPWWPLLQAWFHPRRRVWHPRSVCDTDWLEHQSWVCQLAWNWAPGLLTADSALTLPVLWTRELCQRKRQTSSGA